MLHFVSTNPAGVSIHSSKTEKRNAENPTHKNNKVNVIYYKLFQNPI